MAAPAFRSASAVARSNVSGTGVTPSAPAGVAVGDILYLMGMCNVSGTAMSITADGTGWTQLATVSGSGGFQSMTLWRYIVTSLPLPTMPTVDVAFNSKSAQVFAFSGADTTTPEESVDTNTGATSSSITGVALTTTDVDRLGVQIWGLRDDTTGTPAAGWTEEVETISAANSTDDAIALDTKTIASAGTEGAPTRTLAASELWSVIGFAIIPGAGDTNDELTASSLTTTSPALGTPALTQVHGLTATALTTSSPALGTPALSELVALTANTLSVGSPALGTPSLAQAHVLTATSLTTSSPALGTPALGQHHSLTATAVAGSSLALGTPALEQHHDLSASSLAAGSPVLGTPALGDTINDLTANSLVVSSPALGTPALTQVHLITASGIEGPSPALATPALTQAHGLAAMGLATTSPVLGEPTATHNHDTLTAANLIGSAPVLANPALTQLHALNANPLVIGSPDAERPTLDPVPLTIAYHSLALGVGLQI